MCLLAELLLRPQALRLLRPIRINGVATCDRCSRDRREATWHGQIGFWWIFSWFSCDLLGVFWRFWMGWDMLRYVEMCGWPTRNEITLQIQRQPQFRCVLPLTLVALVAWLNLHPVPRIDHRSFHEHHHWRSIILRHFANSYVKDLHPMFEHLCQRKDM